MADPEQRRQKKKKTFSSFAVRQSHPIVEYQTYHTLTSEQAIHVRDHQHV